MKMPGIKRTILLVGTPAVLLAGGLTTMAASAATPTPTATPSQQSQAETATETAAEANEPALAGGGHADPANANVDNQFEGVQ